MSFDPLTQCGHYCTPCFKNGTCKFGSLSHLLCTCVTGWSLFSRGKAATYLRFAWNRYIRFVNNLVLFVTVKKISKSVKIWRSYRQIFESSSFEIWCPLDMGTQYTTTLRPEVAANWKRVWTITRIHVYIMQTHLPNLCRWHVWLTVSAWQHFVYVVSAMSATRYRLYCIYLHKLENWQKLQPCMGFCADRDITGGCRIVTVFIVYMYVNYTSSGAT